MKFSRFEVVIFTLALVVSILTFILPLSVVCATIAPPCEPIYFQQKLPLEGSIIFTSIIFSIAFFIVTFNRIRKEIGVFGGWGSLFLKTIISWLVGAALAVILIWIFWRDRRDDGIDGSLASVIFSSSSIVYSI